MLLAFLPGTGESAAQLASSWLLLGFWVLAGLLAGALCGYLAVGRGLSPVRWFFAGLLLNVAGIAALLLQPRVRVSPGADPWQVVPPGLKKVERTFAPVRCPACGSPQHPSSQRCSACGRPLRPVAASDMSRL